MDVPLVCPFSSQSSPFSHPVILQFFLTIKTTFLPYFMLSWKQLLALIYPLTSRMRVNNLCRKEIGTKQKKYVPVRKRYFFTIGTNFAKNSEGTLEANRVFIG